MKQTDFAIRGYQIETKAGFEWVIEYPDLPGVTGGGASYDEALKEAEDNKRFYFDYLREIGRPIPAPRDITDIAALSGRITLRLTKSLHQSIIRRADLERVSINSLINEGLSQYLSACDAKTLIENVVSGKTSFPQAGADPVFVIQEQRRAYRKTTKE